MAENTITEQLAKPFDPKLVQQKTGAAGRKFSYVAGELVIERLNLVLGAGAWGWRITSHEIGESAVVVTGELDACGHTYSGMDTHPLHLENAQSPQQISDALGNALKSADTGALVRAARLLGVGLYLWRGGSPQEADVEAEQAAAEAEQAAKQHRHQLLVSIAGHMKRLHWTPKDIETWCDGQSPRALSIEDLEARAAEIAELDPAAQVRRARLLEAARPLGWALDSVDRAIGEMLKVKPERLTSEGETTVLKHILSARASRAADRLSLDKKALHKRLGGAPVTIEPKALEAAVAILEAEAEERGQ